MDLVLQILQSLLLEIHLALRLQQLPTTLLGLIQLIQALDSEIKLNLLAALLVQALARRRPLQLLVLQLLLLVQPLRLGLLRLLLVLVLKTLPVLLGQLILNHLLELSQPTHLGLQQQIVLVQI